MSLKAVLTSILTVLGVLILAAVGSLGLLTSYLHRVTTSMRTSVEGVRLAEELEVELLTHNRQKDVQLNPVQDSRLILINSIEARIRTLLDEIEAKTDTPEERVMAHEIRQKVNAYLVAYQRVDGAPPGQLARQVEPVLDQALTSLENLIEFNVREASSAQDQATHWDRLAALSGTTVAVLLLIGMLTVLVWVRRSVLQPVVRVSQAMRHFGSGSKSTRAPETGPTELREMAKTFNEMAASLARQQEDQLTFLAGVAHDLRNPLSALKMSTALVDPGQPEGSPERIQKMLGLVRRQVARLDRMVGDLLDSTRIEAGKLDLKLEARDARELARAVVELYQASGPGHVLSLSVPDAPVPLRCDGTRIEQVLNNLVSNALKYSPMGSHVDVTVAQDGEEALLSVADQGIGISAEERRYLFAPFQRTPGARERAPGAGLGLSVARRIVEAHGGRIEVDSHPGQGSVFRVRLPIVRAAQRVPGASGVLPALSPREPVH